MPKSQSVMRRSLFPFVGFSFKNIPHLGSDNNLKGTVVDPACPFFKFTMIVPLLWSGWGWWEREPHLVVAESKPQLRNYIQDGFRAAQSNRPIGANYKVWKSKFYLLLYVERNRSWHVECFRSNINITVINLIFLKTLLEHKFRFFLYEVLIHFFNQNCIKRR